MINGRVLMETTGTKTELVGVDDGITTPQVFLIVIPPDCDGRRVHVYRKDNEEFVCELDVHELTARLRGD